MGRNWMLMTGGSEVKSIATIAPRHYLNDSVDMHMHTRTGLVVSFSPNELTTRRTTLLVIMPRPLIGGGRKR